MLSKLSSPDSGTMVGLLTAAGVYLIYTNATPNLTDLRAAPAHDKDAESTRKAAAWKSAALVAIVFLVARDLNSYIISGAALVGIDYMFKHQNGVSPQTGKLDTGAERIAPSLSTAYPMPDYADASN